VLNSIAESELGPSKLLRKMVGPWGLEPQTSTVSILQSMMAMMSKNEFKWHSPNGIEAKRLKRSWIEVVLKRMSYFS
jgi:hypothetical protein